MQRQILIIAISVCASLFLAMGCGADIQDATCTTDAECYENFGCDVNSGICRRKCVDSSCPSGYRCSGSYCYKIQDNGDASMPGDSFSGDSFTGDAATE